MKKNVAIKSDSVKQKILRPTIIWFVLGAFLGALIMFFITANNPSNNQKQAFKLERQAGFQYINPLLDCENYQSSNLRGLSSLKENINQYIAKAKQDKKVSHVSVYYRDLNNGPWIGINEFEYFTPASLLKLPIVMAVYKKAETNPEILQNNIIYEASREGQYTANIDDKIQIKIGETYTINQLIEYTLRYSDNNAKDILEWFIGPAYVDSVYSQIGLKISNRDQSKDFLTIKEYASFFRILYNSSFLSREYSQKLLELLSYSEFKDGIPAKIPKEVTISHKYGERGYKDSPLKQLHDCGIVYLKNKPYIICIMTKGDDFKNQTDFISGLSEVVYKTVE
jgi:beta-lactamase class A